MLKAGAAEKEITPEYPVFLAGYPHVKRISEGTHDPLLANAVYLENNGHAALIISLDLLLIGIDTARKLRKRIAVALNIPENTVFASCTHSHSGPLTANILAFKHDPVVPEVNWEYVEKIIEKAISVALAAKHSAVNAEMAWTSVCVDGVGCNRHSPESVRDPEAGVLAIREKGSGKMLSLSLIYSMHPTVLHEDSKFISGDFPAFTRQTLQEVFGNGLTVTYHMGPAGNQSPRYHVKSQTFAEAERLGHRLGQFIIDAINLIEQESYDSNPVICGLLKTIEPIPKKISSVEDSMILLKNAREEYASLKRANSGHGPIRTAECAVFGAEETYFLAQCSYDGRLEKYLMEYETCDIQTLRIGDTCLIGLPGELFVEYSLEIKLCAKIRSFVVSLVNGDMQGYIVTKSEKSGYEVANALFAPETGKIMIDAALNSLDEIAR
jgi:hypothetical protein